VEAYFGKRMKDRLQREWLPGIAKRASGLVRSAHFDPHSELNFLLQQHS
jgi:hypothetical protein